MASQHTSTTLEATPQLFVLRYRCLGCGLVVEGCEEVGSDRTICENCQASLDEDDQVAHPAHNAF